MIQARDIYKRIRKDHVARYKGTGHIYHHKVRANVAWKSAKHQAKVLNKWEELEEKGVVRFKVVLDEHPYDMDDLAGDTFDPKVNSDIQPHILEREEKEFIDRVNRDGIWGIQSQYFNGEEWIHADSVWGFIGNDWEGSGYDIDVKSQAIDQYENLEFCDCCGRPRNRK